MAVPVRPLPELQCTMITFSGSAATSKICKIETESLTFEIVVALFGDLVQEGKGRAVVVGPVVISHTAAEVPR